MPGPAELGEQGGYARMPRQVEYRGFMSPAGPGLTLEAAGGRASARWQGTWNHSGATIVTSTALECAWRPFRGLNRRPRP